tara:strand:- start:1182 stop:1367 length:186 start_codon:yes stop_codon:yes gene_type:complete
MKKPNDNYSALVLALELAVTAPTQTKSEQLLAMAEELADIMSDVEVLRAKQEAEKNLEADK